LGLLALAASALFVSPLAALTMAATAAALFSLFHPLARRARELATEQGTAALAFAERVSETVRIAEAVQAYAIEEPTRARIASDVDGLARPVFRLHFLSQLVSGAYQTLAIVFVMAGLGALYFFGAHDLASSGAVVLILMRC